MLFYGCLLGYLVASCLALHISVGGQPTIQVATPVQWTREPGDPQSFIFRILAVKEIIPSTVSPPIEVSNSSANDGQVLVVFQEVGTHQILAFSDRTQEGSFASTGPLSVIMGEVQTAETPAFKAQPAPSDQTVSTDASTMTVTQSTPSMSLPSSSLDQGAHIVPPSSRLVIILGCTLGLVAILVTGIFMWMLSGCGRKTSQRVQPFSIRSLSGLRRTRSGGKWSTLTSLNDLEDQIATTSEYSYTESSISSSRPISSGSTVSYSSKMAVRPETKLVINEKMRPTSDLSYVDSPSLSPLALLQSPATAHLAS